MYRNQIRVGEHNRVQGTPCKQMRILRVDERNEYAMHSIFHARLGSRVEMLTSTVTLEVAGKVMTPPAMLGFMHGTYEYRGSWEKSNDQY